MPAKTIADLPDQRIAGTRILVRVDFNVPLDSDGRITDDTRIVRALPTLSYLLERGGRLVVTSHLGRPKGGADPAFSLRPVADHLSDLLAFPVRFCPELVGPGGPEGCRGAGRRGAPSFGEHPVSRRRDEERSGALPRLWPTLWSCS